MTENSKADNPKEEEEINSLKEEIDSLKKNKEINKLKEEVKSLKTKNKASSVTKTSSIDPALDELKGKRNLIGILAILIGGLGVHKFMLGYNPQGFIILGVTVLGSLLCGIGPIVTGIIAIIEGIIILTKTPQEFKEMYIDNKKVWF